MNLNISKATFHSAVAILAVVCALAATLTVVAQAPAGRDRWDVEKNLGFARAIEFETDEGTWMNLDVSPDGRWIVFEMLGDLYRVPYLGGDAELILGGAAYDQQPRFSSDGRTIAFISDRNGADQVWLMNADGTDRRALTIEREFLPTNPTWTPDGDYIVAKRHVVDTRSAGGGELMLYHKAGGDGVVLVPRQGFTSEMNEPSLSKDGRWVYFVQAGPFDYNRDPHAGIFAITRFDRHTGRREPVVRGPGGGIRPTISRDGAKMAYIRRVGLKSVLFVRDLESGAERQLFDGLDPDQMETWTIHGAYPTFAWTPNDAEIIVTAGGKFVAVNAQTGATRTIPFRARVKAAVTDTVHFPQAAWPADTLRAHVIRWPGLTPNASRLVFQAVGRIWQMALPDGKPERVTDGDRLEFAPAVSPDGQWVAFTTWHEDEGGALWKTRLIPGRRSTPQKLTSAPDQYANPAWSPDGRRIAFVQGSGAVNRGADLTGEFFLRIRWIGADGGEVSDVTTTGNRGPNSRMPRLHWSAGGDRLLYQENVQNSTRLASIALDGTDLRHLAQNENADEMVPSPDGEWIAFKEYHNVYVAPLPRAGAGPVMLASRGSPMPVKQLTRYAGDWIDWSPDGRSIFWTFGPAVERVDVARVYERKPEEERKDPPAKAAAKSESQDEKKPEPPRPNAMAEGPRYEIHLEVPRARPEGVVALTGARIITMKGDEVIERGTVIIENNRIREVGAANRVRIPAGAKTIDLRGKTIIPGLIDVHAHMGYIALDINPHRAWQYYANLAYGVTTTHDPSASTQFVFSNSELVEAGEIVGPRVYSTGFVLYGARSSQRATTNSLDDARGHLKRLKALGAFSVKSYNQRRRDSRQWIIAAAREEKMMVYPEGGSQLQQNLQQVIDGHTGIEHAIPVAPLYKDVITLTAKSGTAYTPTLIVGYGGVWGENYWYQKSDVYKNERLLRFVPRGLLDARSRRRMMVPDDEFFHFRLSEQAKKIVDAGGQVHLGAHGQLQGLGVHWELWMLVQGGMTPLEALRAATLAGARYLGMADALGSIEPGKLADLVVLDANPLENIQNSERVSMVMKNGVLYNDNLDELWPREQKRGRLRAVAE